MNKSLLMTVGNDQSSRYKLNFVSNFFSDKSLVDLTLFYVAPCIIDDEYDKKIVQWFEAGAEARAGCDTTHGRRILEDDAKWLKAMGFPGTHITTKVACAERGTASEIMHEAVHGLYDSVLMGYRGLSWLSGIMDSSTNQTLLEQDIDFPLWICHRPEYHKAGVLLCTGADQASMRMADHVGYMLGGAPDMPVDVLHVNIPGGPDLSRMVIGSVMDILMANGVDRDRIQVLKRTADSAYDGIVAEVKSTPYAVCALGMTTPISRSISKNTGFRLLRKLEKTALWICR